MLRLREIKLHTFRFLREISKMALIFIEFSESYHFKFAGIFEAQKPRESRLFCFEKGRWLSAPDSRPFSCFREDGFFRFFTQLFRA